MTDETFHEGRVYAEEQLRNEGLTATQRSALSRDFGIYYAEQDELTPVGLWKVYAHDIGGHWESYAKAQVVRFDRECGADPREDDDQ